MAIQVALYHQTRYSFDRPIALSPHEFRLRPAAHCRTPILSYSIKVAPEKHFVNWQQDAYGNYVARYVFPEPTRELVVEVDLTADMTVINPFDFFVEASAERYPFTYEERLSSELSPFRTVEPAGPLLSAWIERFKREHLGAPINSVDLLVALNREIQREVKYVVRLEPGVYTPEETLERKIGSCRDSDWLLVHILRHLGFAARFVSGYLIQLTADVKALDGPSGPEADFTDLHAWAEAFVPGAGWIGLDATSGLMAGEGHIPLACTAVPASAAPVYGFSDLAEVQFDFSMRVTRIHEDPRVTKPYDATQWHDIDRLGERVEDELKQGDVRLTMGGEPTFVSIDDMDGAEWNYEALGEKKRELAGSLIARLRNRFAPGGLLHWGQGKWYPGEPLPRWALTCLWRADRMPLWHMVNGVWRIADGKDADIRESNANVRESRVALGVKRTASSVERTASGVGREALSHIVRIHVDLNECEGLVFTAYRPDAPYDVLTEDMVGSGIARKGDFAALWFDAGNFEHGWHEGEEVIVIVEALKDGNAQCNVVGCKLNATVDIQELGMIALEPLVEVLRNNGNIIGFSTYANNRRSNIEIIALSSLSAVEDQEIRPVIRGGYETVHSLAADAMVAGSCASPTPPSITPYQLTRPVLTAIRAAAMV